MGPEIEAYAQRARRGPRLTYLFDEFRSLASGEVGQPKRHVLADPLLLANDLYALRFMESHTRHAATFNAHFLASIPYIFEEQCRFGAALWRYGSSLAQRRHRPSSIYTLGDAAGVTARALAQVSKGSIRTLTCSPNRENQEEFFTKGTPPDAYFFLGPFFDLTPEVLSNGHLAVFAGGFDVIVEDTTFQMYGPERYEPIALARRNLREDGIFVLIEKLSCDDASEYRRRERQKDDEFKTHYFDAAQIAAKRSTILRHMQEQEVSLSELTSVLRRHFSAAVVTWNSGNFYTIAASNNHSGLADLVNAMIEPAIPDEFCYETLPRLLFGSLSDGITFRKPITA
jgi:hypothetical protein